jgi:hypothetical protein
VGRSARRGARPPRHAPFCRLVTSFLDPPTKPNLLFSIN